MSLPFRLKISVVTLSFSVILLVSAIIRIGHFDYPLAFGWGDGARDYLVAHHTLAFQEIPLIGPFNPLHAYGVRNTPLYYYFLSIFLTPHDSILFLGIVNIVLQLFTIVLVFLLGKGLFRSGTTGLIAVTLFSFSPRVLDQSVFIWQPHVMQPFLFLSMLLLFLSYQKKGYPLLLTSIVTFIFSASMHNLAFILLPQFLFLSLLILKKQGATRKKYIGLIACSVSSLILFYIPILIALLQGKIAFNLPTPMGQSGVSLYVSTLLFNASRLLVSFFSETFSNPLSLGGVLAIATVLIFTAYFRFVKNHTAQKWYVVLLVVATIQLVAVISLFLRNYQHYLTPAYGFIALALAGVIDATLSKRLLLRLGKILFIIFLLKTTSSDFQFLKFHHAFEKARTIESASQAVQREIISVQKENHYSDLRFFQIASYAQQGSIFRFPRLDSVLIVPLEERFGIRLVAVSDDPESYTQLSGRDYMIVACYDFDTYRDWIDCSRPYLADFKGYRIVKGIYTNYPFSIYLTKKI